MTTLSERLEELSGKATPGAFRQGTDPANSYRIYANIGRVAEVICGESRANEATAADGNFHPDYLAMLTRPLPQPSELVAEVKRLTTLADDHFRNARRLSEVVVARDAQIAKLQADGDKLAGALRHLHAFWQPGSNHDTQEVTYALEAARQALTEWKDRA